MAEPVRLVVWDLDDTFWDGTLSEGAIVYRPDRHAIVAELAGRGIVSSICSKNDLGAVRTVLTEHGLWDRFVFPSIDWTAKGPRLAGLIEDFQLRPASVLFIDDNPANLREALHFVPDLQVAGPEFVARLLDDPMLAGKPDSELTRLRHYKVLEERTAARHAAGGDNVDFLRASRIRVRFEFAIDTHLDRAVELVSRTNQLNFTKNRLAADPVAAREELLTLASNSWVQVGLVHVVDAHGDHGLVGFYAVIRTPSAFRLAHFCFSCRILGMGVERFVYRRLGRPAIGIRGDVAADLFAEGEIDWISVDESLSGAKEAVATAAVEYETAYVRGGCDLRVLEHYIRLGARSVTSELSFAYQGIELRIDHSLLLAYALRPPDADALGVLEACGYPREVFETALARDAQAPSHSPALYVFSFGADAYSLLYRDRLTDLVVPIHLHQFLGADLTAIPVDAFAARIDNDFARATHRFLRDRCECLGRIAEPEFKVNLATALRAIPDSARIHIVLLNDTPPGAAEPMLYHVVAINRWITEATGGDQRVRLVSIRDCVHQEVEVKDTDHFDRNVYYRLARRILSDKPELRDRAAS